MTEGRKNAIVAGCAAGAKKTPRRKTGARLPYPICTGRVYQATVTYEIDIVIARVIIRRTSIAGVYQAHTPTIFKEDQSRTPSGSKGSGRLKESRACNGFVPDARIDTVPVLAPIVLRPLSARTTIALNRHCGGVSHPEMVKAAGPKADQLTFTAKRPPSLGAVCAPNLRPGITGFRIQRQCANV